MTLLLISFITPRSKSATLEVEILLLALLGAGIILLLFFLWRTRNELLSQKLQNDLSQQQLSTLKEEKRLLEGRLEERQKEENRYIAQISSLETTLQKEREMLLEKERFLTQTQERLKLEFGELAQKFLEEKGERLGQKQNETLGLILKPLSEQIKTFRQKVEETHAKEMEGRAVLENEIKNLKALNLKISEEALHLAQALKGESKTQGSWGEMILEKILEDSGLSKGREYEVQTSFKSEEGRLLRPDVIVHLPENRDVVIDSKASLTAYERFIHSQQPQDIAEHIRSIKNHLKELSSKSYDSLLKERSLDFVLMFIPIEGAFIEALRHDPRLFVEAYEKNIILVSPSTLLVTLRTIHHIWRYERQSQNAEEIAREAGSMYDKLVGFTEDFLKIGEQIEKSEKIYSEALAKLKEGKGNLIRRAERLRELGVKSKKSLDSRLDSLGD